MASLADIRARIAAQDNKTKSGTSTQSDNSIYPRYVSSNRTNEDFKLIDLLFIGDKANNHYCYI